MPLMPAIMLALVGADIWVSTYALIFCSQPYCGY